MSNATDTSLVSEAFSINPTTTFPLSIFAESSDNVDVLIPVAVAGAEPLAHTVPDDKSP